MDAIREANKLWKVGAYVCVLTVALLRGHEGIYLDLAGMRKHVAKGRTGVVPAGLSKTSILTEEDCLRLPHVTICLLGKFKGETGVDHHLITVANMTSSSLQARWWMEKLLEVCEGEGRFNGPAFASPDGQLAYLKLVQEETDLVPLDHDVDALYSTFQLRERRPPPELSERGSATNLWTS